MLYAVHYTAPVITRKKSAAACETIFASTCHILNKTDQIRESSYSKA